MTMSWDTASSSQATVLCVATDRERWETLEEGFHHRHWRVHFVHPQDPAGPASDTTAGPPGSYVAVMVDLDAHMPWGQSCANFYRGLCPELPVVAISRFCGTEVLTKAVACGADTVIGFFPTDTEWQELESRTRYVKKQSLAAPAFFAAQGLITQDQAVIHCATLAARLSKSEVNILLSGPTGVGKEMLARIAHGNDPSEKPFVDVNCAALTEQLVESELFGHAKGAFSGATSDKPGLILSANRGTLFLDEIGELSRPIQSKLLHTLETGEVRPVGSDRAQKSKFKVIAATHRDLNAFTAAGRFREDLLYRLNAFTITLPALDERPGDIALLAQYFLFQSHTSGTHAASTFAADALQVLMDTNWPGNVRELKNFVRLCAASSGGPVVSKELVIKLKSRHAVSADYALNKFVRESDLLSLALSLANGKVSGAAKILKKNRTELYRLIKTHVITPLLVTPPDHKWH